MTFTAPAPRIEPLSDQHDRESFASGVESLDGYLRQQAGQDARRRIASCFVLVSDGDRVPIGYYTLAATSIALAELPESLTKRLPRYPVVPATLMGRLAVDARHRREGHGEFMLFDAFSRVLRSDIASYAFVVDAKATSKLADCRGANHRLHPEGEAKPRVSKDGPEGSAGSARAEASFETRFQRSSGRGGWELDAKDDNAAQFYHRYRFKFLVEGGPRLFIPVAEIAKLFS